MAERITAAWSRRAELEGGEHLLDGYFEVDDGTEPFRDHFHGLPYAKVIGEFAHKARELSDAKLCILRLDQTPQPVLMPLSDAMALLLREDPVTYIKSTNPPAVKVKLKITDDAVISKVTPNIHQEDGVVEPFFRSPIPAGYDTIAEAFGDDIYCRVSGALVECPACGRWAHSSPDDEADLHVRCDSCLFEDVFTLIVSTECSWAVIPTEALLQKGNRRFFIPRAWNKDGPWVKSEELKRRYETFCKERNDASERD